MTIGSVTVRLPRRRRMPRVSSIVVATLLAFAAAALILGRAGMLGTPISYVVVTGHSMEPTFHTGDLVVLRRASSYHPGEVVAYEVPKGSPGAGLLVIHRIIGGNPREGYVIQGDNKPSPDPWRPRPADVVGHEALMVPKVGLWIAYMRTPLGLAVLAGLITTAIAFSGSGGKPATAPAPDERSDAPAPGLVLERRHPRLGRLPRPERARLSVRRTRSPR